MLEGSLAVHASASANAGGDALGDGGNPVF